MEIQGQHNQTREESTAHTPAPRVEHEYRRERRRKLQQLMLTEQPTLPLIRTNLEQSLEAELLLLDRSHVYEATFRFTLPGVEGVTEHFTGVLSDCVMRQGERQFRLELEEEPPEWMYDLMPSTFDDAMRRKTDIVVAMWLPLHWIVDGRISAFRMNDRQRLALQVLYVVRHGALSVPGRHLNSD